MSKNEVVNMATDVDVDTSTDFMVDDAREANENEKQMSLLQGLRRYPKAMGWSVLLSTALVMEGYDTALIGSFYALPAFQKKFGQPDGNGGFQLTAAWQAGLSNGINCGEILGLILAGYCADRFGYRTTIGGALMLVAAFIFIVFFAKNVEMLLIGEILCGIPWGVFQTVTTTYASDVCPVVLRAYLTTYVNLCWVFGQLIASGVLRAMSSRSPDDPWGYKIPFAIQWMWPVPLLIGVCLAPESPWWLVRKGRYRDALRSLERLTTADTSGSSVHLEKTLAMMIHTNEVEKESEKGTSYGELFRGVNLRRTEVTSLVWVCQGMCGSVLQGYSSYFYEQAGLTHSFAFNLTMIQYGLGVCGTILSWFFMRFFGRRTLYLIGLGSLLTVLFLIGFLSLGHGSGISWAIGSMLLIHTFVYDFTVGPACYSLVPEMASTRLRSKSTAVARNMYNCFGIMNNVLTPYMLNPTAWNWGAKVGFYWGGICSLCFTWAFFRLPEPKGRTYAELDMLFDQRVPARKFSSTVVDPFSAHPTVAADTIEAKLQQTQHLEEA